MNMYLLYTSTSEDMPKRLYFSILPIITIMYCASCMLPPLYAPVITHYAPSSYHYSHIIVVCLVCHLEDSDLTGQSTNFKH